MWKGNVPPLSSTPVNLKLWARGIQGPRRWFKAVFLQHPFLSPTHRELQQRLFQLDYFGSQQDPHFSAKEQKRSGLQMV